MGGSARVDGESPIVGGAAGLGRSSDAPLGTSYKVDNLQVDLVEGSQAETPHASAVGRTLEILRRKLLVAGASLQSCVEPAGRELVSETSRMLQKQVCRIAVIGQIKSGKSSFINAFAQQPDLLPTDVNPWTTAVTNLHFRQKSPEGGPATFRFFAEQEWEELIEGAGKMRELTKRLVPGFEPELLRQHVDALRRRAESRLGTEFQTLLGQTHTFPEIDSNLLKRYVCSGIYSGDQAPALGSVDQGHYSDITKSADIYCEDGPFAFPITLVDTPGTNDPFLLRDEVTRSSLEAADLYIVVLTARQPLSEADVALLRILRGLHKDRILVFVNRIDDLANIGSDVDEVMGFVKKKIAAEFPGADIPVIAGCARWVSSALEPDKTTFEQMVKPRTLSYLSEIGALRREDMVGPAEEGEAKNEALRRALFIGSGIPAVYEELSNMLGTSHCAHVLRQVSQCYEELARGARISARSELDQLNSAHANSVSTAHNTVETIRKIDAELRQLGDMTTVIEQSARDLETKLHQIIADEMDAMRTQMESEVAAQAREEANVLVDTLNRGRVPRVWRCEVGELRSRLNELFVSRFERAAARVLDLQGRVAPELRQLTKMVAPDGEVPSEPQREQMEIPTPSAASLGRFVALDLDTPWWRAWWSRGPGVEERGQELDELIRSEFQPVVEELVTSAQEELNRYCSMTLRWSFTMCRNLIQSMQRRRISLRENAQQLSQSTEGDAVSDIVSRQAKKISELRDRAQLSERLSREFGQVYRAISSLLQRVPVE